MVSSKIDRTLNSGGLTMAQIRKAVATFQSDEVAATARNPEIAAALAARARLDAAFAAQDAEETAALFARDLIVNAPSNRVARRDAVMGFFKAGRMDYESVTETIEALEARGDYVVMMGEEVVKPSETAPNPGKTVRRRFTDVWRKESDGQWRLTIRQATITSVE
jgi:ketosteroid isomerase-like protein